ncbi:MAG: hypothetical protein L0Y55_09275, partial [Anaerolineales bacterium]|nr:hypothetical protein [Anaerolineales bacterium]
MKKKNATKGAIPIQLTADDDLLPEYDIDYSKAKRNRFAGKKQVVIGPVPDDYELPAEYPLDPAKMKPNPYAARIKTASN